MQTLSFISDKFLLLFSGFIGAPKYVQAGAFIFLIFLLVLSLAQFRQHFVKWSLKGGIVGLFFGVLLTLILEGFLLVSGNTFLTSVLKWKNPPKPFSTALDRGKVKLTNVLGVDSSNPTSTEAINLLQNLDPDEISKIKAIMCTQ